jgi:putative peptidoglycan lipid II flippase
MPAPSADHASANSAEHATGVLAAAVRVVSGLTLLSRFAGLARDVITARIFGDSLLGSAFRAAYALPNLFRRLFGEGALSAAFIPQYALLRRDDPARAQLLANAIVALLTLTTSALTGLIMLGLLVRLWLFPITEDAAISVKLILLMIPMMPAVCIAAILAGVLQTQNKFAIPAAAPILLNLFQIAAGVLYFLAVIESKNTAAYVIGLAALLASWATVAWSLHALKGQVAWHRLSWRELRDPASATGESVRKVLSRFLPVVLGLGTLQLNTMLDTVIAMWPVWIGPTMFGRPTPLDESSNAIISYTQTLYQFPLGVFGIAVATAIFPLLSSTSDRTTEFAEHLRRGLRLSFFIALPATIGLILVRHDLIAAVFGGGSKTFTDEGLARAAAVLMGFAPGVWAYSLNHVMTRAYYAKGDTKTPMRVAIACVLINLTLNLTLIWRFKEAGLAWATATSATVQVLTLILLAPRLLGVRPITQDSLLASAKIAVAAGCMAGAVLALQHFEPRLIAATNLTETLSPDRWLTWTLRLAGCVLVGAGTYAVAAVLLRLPELRWLTQRAPRGGSGGSGVSGMSFD